MSEKYPCFICGENALDNDVGVAYYRTGGRNAPICTKCWAKMQIDEGAFEEHELTVEADDETIDMNWPFILIHVPVRMKREE